MADSVRPGVDSFRTIYKQSFGTWTALHAAATAQTLLPPSHLAIHLAFRHHPPFPPNLRLKHVKFTKHSQIYATGCSAWDSSGTCSGCEHGLPAVQQPEQVPIASKGPIMLPTTPKSEAKVDWMSWFAQQDHNYLAVLILAWSYILSARWVEIMPGSTSLVYKSSMADTEVTTTASFDQHMAALNIGDAGPAEARWWAAVLAQDQGWQANISMGGDIHFASWSIRRLQPTCQFGLVVSSAIPKDQLAPPTAVEALRFLDRFCFRQNIADQSQAALAAVLLLPSIGTTKEIQLPVFTANLKLQIPTPASTPLTQEQLLGTNSGSFTRSPIDNGDHLDRLISLSCYIKGVRPMLLSPFFNPLIECNTVTPWFQGPLTAIHLLAQTPSALGRMLMDRQPNVAPLWVGAIVLGLQKQILHDVSFGMIPIDLLSAAWSETVQSFVQEQTSEPLVKDGNISRADQCRLLFLSRSEMYKRVPICQWRSFGENTAQNADLEVQTHAQCKEHRLRYRGFTWDCGDRTTAHYAFTGDDPAPPRQAKSHTNQAPVDFSDLDPEKDFLSENSTRNIFGWLRVEGYATGERDIWEHEWFDDVGDDEEEGESNNSCADTSKMSAGVEAWLSEVSYQTEKLASSRTPDL